MSKQPHELTSDLKNAADAEKTHLDELLDEALDATFPASDALAITQPTPHAPPRDKGDKH
jgi:hypothetical protein